MIICEVIIFTCLFAKFFCEEIKREPLMPSATRTELKDNEIEVCYDCPNEIRSNSSCIFQRCNCDDSPRIRFRVDREDYERTEYSEIDAKDVNGTKTWKSVLSSSTPDNTLYRQPPPNTIPLELETPRVHCKEAEYILLHWNISQPSSQEYIFYYVRYWVAGRSGNAYETALTRCNFAEITHLAAGATYRVELRSFSLFPGKESPKQARSRQINVTTREYDTPPFRVSAFYLARWILQDNRKYTAFVRWIKAGDAACFYNLVYFPRNGDYQEFDIDNPLVNNGINITDLEMGSYYEIAISPYTLSAYESPLEGPKKWLNISTPTCLESYNEINSCKPDKPQDLVVKEYPLHNNKQPRYYNVIMEWHKPKYVPTYYRAYVKLLDVNSTEFVFNITGQNTNVTFSKIPLTSEYEALLVAYSKRGPSQPAVIHRQVVANVTLVETDESLVSIEFILMIIIPLVIVAVLIMCLLNRFFTKKMRNQERNKFLKHFEEKSSRPSTITTISTITFCENTKADEWEIDTNKLAVKEVLGGGAFGIVRKGWYTLDAVQTTEVAIKMLRENPTHEEFKQFYQEIEIMKSVPLHPHLVSLIGCVTKQNLLLVVEFCSKGDLQTYLRTASDKILKTSLMNEVNDFEKSKYVSNKMYDFSEVDFEDIPQPKDLISIARQTALGMEFLASQKVIHRDLAARNVLLTKNNVAKISDFGLSRDVYYDNIYYKVSSGKLPIRWMALESMTHQIYTTHSDVWSFGILLWEIVTLGGTPYPGVQTQEVLGMLKGGYRMKKPDNCSEELYEIMCKCWNATPIERPSFIELRIGLDNLLATFTEYLNLDTNIIKNLECIER